MYTQSSYVTTKSATCFSKSTRKPVSQYPSERDAKSAASFILTKHGNDLVPYKCRRCGFWHLSPKVRCTPTEKCPICTSGEGESKDSYRTESEAGNRAKIILKERGVSLKVYCCEYGYGWHLTKQL